MAESDSLKAEKWSGLRNTVSPERLGPSELARARNIDLDDAGQAHRRRGYRVAALGRFHSVFNTIHDQTYVVKDGVLCRVLPGYRFSRIMTGIADDPLCFCEVGPTLYISSARNSLQLDLRTDMPSAWGSVRDHSLQPGLDPAPIDWWYSPVARAVPSTTRPGDFDLPPVKGKLLGAPYPCSTMAYFNGRIYMAVGNVLWVTELFLYSYVDKTAGYRQFEAAITAIGSVDDGVWVGTEDGLYFITGRFGEEVRSVKMLTSVLPGSMVEVPADMISPNARNRLDLPSQTGLSLAMMTTEGLVACLPGGQVFNLTRAQFAFPIADRAASMLRYQDGMHTVIQSLDSDGTPANETARFGDYLEARIIRAADVKATPATDAGTVVRDTILATGVFGGQPGAQAPSEPIPPAVIVEQAGGGDGTESFTLGAQATAYTAMMFNPDGSGTLVPAQPVVGGYVYAGISLSGGNVGQQIEVQEEGNLTVTQWSWRFGYPVFVLPNGALSQVPPLTGFSQIIGFATGVTTIRLKPEDVIDTGA